MTRRLVTIMMLALSFCIPSSAQKAAGSRSAKVEKEVLQVERKWDDAIAGRDKAALERILADDFLVVDAGGITTKRQLIENIMSPDVVVEPFQTEDTRIRVHGGTVIVTARFAQRGTYRGKEFSAQYRYTDVYVRRGGRWKAVSAQSTRIPK